MIDELLCYEIKGFNLALDAGINSGGKPHRDD
jgi:hypothetical protein